MSKTEFDVLGKWVVVDCFAHTPLLIAVGNVELDGLSPWRSLGRLGRPHLAPRLLAVLESGKSIREKVSVNGIEYRVVAIPIRTPDRSMIIGAYGIIAEDNDTPLPPEPLIGAWQWLVDADGQNYGPNASQWDQKLYRIHEYEPDEVSSAMGPVGDWFTKLMPSEDRPEVHTTVTAGLIARNSKHQLLKFGAITRPGTANPGLKKVSLTGTATPIEELPPLLAGDVESRWEHPESFPAGIALAYGFSREVSADRKTAFTLDGLATTPMTSFLRAVLKNIDDPTAIIDAAQGLTFMTNPSWARLGLHADFGGDIASLAADDDRSRFEQYVSAARAEDLTTPIRVRLMTTRGEYRAFSIVSTRIDDEKTPSRYLNLTLSEE